MNIKHLIILFNILIISTINVAAIPSLNWNPAEIDYPIAHRVNKTFDYQSIDSKGKVINVTIDDPYFWLEQVNSTETKSFIEAQMNLTKSYMQKNKDVNSIRNSITQLVNFTEVGGLVSFGPLENQSYLYSVVPFNKVKPIWYIVSEQEMNQIFQNDQQISDNNFPGYKWFDEDLLSKDGSDSIVFFSFSPDAKIVVYGIVNGGGDVSSLYIRNTSSPLINEQQRSSRPGGEGSFDEIIPHYDRAGVRWIEDSSGFFYVQDVRNGSSGYGSRVRFHKIGKPYEEDLTIVQPPKDPYQRYGIGLTEDKKWLLVGTGKSTNGKVCLYIASLIDQPISSEMKWQSISPNFDYKIDTIANLNSTFYFVTDKDGSINGKITKGTIDDSKARKVDQLSDLKDELPMETIIPETDLNYENTLIFDTDKLLIYGVANSSYKTLIYDIQTGELIDEIFKDFHGSITSSSVRQFVNEVFIWTSDCNKPKTIYRISIQTNNQIKIQKVFETKIEGIEGINDIISEQQFSKSKDGTLIPYTLYFRNGTKFNKGPAIVYFYASYGDYNLPSYGIRFVDFILNYEGVVAFGYPRGGGEEGEKWHIEGRRENRTNTVNDVISIVQNLVDTGISDFGKIYINGASAGGTTCMAVTNQAPEGLLGGALCDRGVYDLLRFPSLSITGNPNIEENGDPSNPKDFNWLVHFTPLLNVNSSMVYPTVLLFDTEGDQRVPESDSLKMIATLQYALPKNQHPLLFYLQQGVGHTGEYNSKLDNIEAATVKISIISEGLGLTRKDQSKN